MAVDTDETGQRKLLALIRSLGTGPWTEWEESFIQSIEYRSTTYAQLTTKQKTTVGTLHDKLEGR